MQNSTVVQGITVFPISLFTVTVIKHYGVVIRHIKQWCIIENSYKSLLILKKEVKSYPFGKKTKTQYLQQMVNDFCKLKSVGVILRKETQKLPLGIV